MMVAGAMFILLGIFGLCPEWSSAPMRGIGERLWGLPVLIGAPLAGAALSTGRSQRGLLLGGFGCVLLLAGLLQPQAIVLDLRPAVAHHLKPWHNPHSLGVSILTLLSLLGLAATGIGARREASRLPHIIGGLLIAFLPAWAVIQFTIDGDATHLSFFCVVIGASIWLMSGLQHLLRAVPQWSREWMPLLVEAGAVVGLLAVWLLLKSFTWRWSTTDENIYFYGALRFSEGLIPYRDFFFAHPPMHLVVPAIAFKTFGFSIMLAKLLPVGAVLATALLLFTCLRQYLGKLTAFLGLGSFLFAMELLQASTNLNGVNLTSFWLVLGTLLFLRQRAIPAGIALAFAISSGIYAAAGALALIAMSPFQGRRLAMRFVMAFAITVLLVNGTFWLLGGDAFIEGVYGFHLLKAKKPLIGVFLKALYHHTPLFFGVLLAPVVGAWLRFRNIPVLWEPLEQETRGSFFAPHKLFAEPALGTIKILWLQAVALLIQLALVNELYSFYFVIAFPYAAAALGYTVAGIISAIIHELQLLTKNQPSPLWWGTALLPLAFAGWIPLAAEANWAFSRSGPPKVVVEKDATGAESRRRVRPPAKGLNPEFLIAGERREYQWIPPAALQELSEPVVKALFWRDHRLRMAITPGYRHFLWQKALYFDALDEIAAFVNSTAAPDETVAGNSLVAPAVALASNRRVAADFVDTNAKRFKTGITSLEAFFTAICADKVRYLVTSPSGYFSDRMAQSLPTVRKYFRPAKHFPSPKNKFGRPGRKPWGVTLWEIKDISGGNDTRCEWIEPPSRSPQSPNRRTKRRTSGGGKPVR
jgi:hypothetical protein